MKILIILFAVILRAATASCPEGFSVGDDCGCYAKTEGRILKVIQTYTLHILTITNNPLFQQDDSVGECAGLGGTWVSGESLAEMTSGLAAVGLGVKHQLTKSTFVA